MALAPRLSNLAASAAADAVLALLNNGFLKIYDGLQPATADTAITTQNLLSTLRWNATAFPASVNGLGTANAISGDPAAVATGLASWFRAVKPDGTTVVFDGSVGTVSANLILNSVAIGVGAPVTVTSFTYQQQES